jgi:hypothetical protein
MLFFITNSRKPVNLRGGGSRDLGLTSGSDSG